MPATYPSHVIDASAIPRAADPSRQHLVDVYASEINKVASVWRAFDDGVLEYRPHPKSMTVDAAVGRLAESARARLPHLAEAAASWWEEIVPFFDVERARVWIFWRRVLHTAHHRTQLTLYLRLLDRPVPPVYGPTADVTWSGADPTRTVDAAGRAGLL